MIHNKYPLDIHNNPIYISCSNENSINLKTQEMKMKIQITNATALNRL